MHVLVPVLQYSGHNYSFYMDNTVLRCRYAVQAMFSAYAMYDFGKKHNATAGTWNEDVKETYGTGHSSQYMLFAAAMITWAHRCENTKLPLCNDNKARTWLAIAEQEWIYTVVRTWLLLGFSTPALVFRRFRELSGEGANEAAPVCHAIVAASAIGLWRRVT